MRYKDFPVQIPVLSTQTDHPYKMASWTNDLAKRARRIKQWKAKHEWYTERTEMFALSKAFIEEDPAEDDLWEVHLISIVATSMLSG